MTNPDQDIVWMAGMSCLCCMDGQYKGYQSDKPKTTPCTNCGHVMPKKIDQEIFDLLIEFRESLFGYWDVNVLEKIGGIDVD